MTQRETSPWVTAGIVGAGAAFGLLGAYSSYGAVHEVMRPAFGEKAWTVPIGMDLGIAVFSAMDLWMAWRDTRTWWLRWVPHGLSVATIWFNVVDEAPIHVRGAHALLVALWIIFAAVITHEVKLWALGKQKVDRLDRIRPVRWLLALRSTLRIWQWMITREVTSYDEARRQVDDWRLGVASLKDTHGRKWRRRMSHRDRELLRQGRLSVPGVVAPAIEAALTPEPPKPVPKPQENGHLDAAAERIADRLKGEGKNVSRRALLAGLRAEGYELSTDRAAQLARTYQ